MPVSVRPFDDQSRKRAPLMHAMPGTADRDARALAIDVGAAIMSVRDDVPAVVLASKGGDLALPGGPVRPGADIGIGIGLEDDLRRAVVAATGLTLGHVEQLCTLPLSRAASNGTDAGPGVCISYLALTRPGALSARQGGCWAAWYEHLPWEDWREGRPRVLSEVIEPALHAWAGRAAGEVTEAGFGVAPADRVRLAFGGADSWDEERVADRYEVLHASGLLVEAHGQAPRAELGEQAGHLLAGDHRHRLAIAIGRLRAKMKYRPVVFELMAPEFTLFELQRVVEAILGTRLHKQNFRRLVEGTGLVEPTGETKLHTGGRPAKQMRFRREVIMERACTGLRVRSGRA